MKRLLLFDIDGTLVWGGPAKDAFHAAMLETFGTAGDIENFSFAGRTDPQIARGLLAGTGMSDEDIERGFPVLWDLYLSDLEARLPDHPVEILPGVPALLDALQAENGIAMGLLTGNIVQGARLKLGSAGLLDHFEMGSYGSDHEERDELPAIALSRARQTWGVDFDPREVVVVGDTPRDVACGQREGLRTLAVATGTYDAEALKAAGADQVVEDFRDTDAMVSLLGIA
jgi:phosphoglycolate phosphatase-like HAD superfamily hydrolase